MAFGEVTLDGIEAEANLFFWLLTAAFTQFYLTNRKAPFASGEVAMHARNV